jgi:hypothetical protein
MTNARCVKGVPGETAEINGLASEIKSKSRCITVDATNVTKYQLAARSVGDKTLADSLHFSHL